VSLLGVKRRLANPVIDSTYPLADTLAALRYIETGHAHGKVVVAI
jgi:NADPH:quinone reductase-like Zn-dependent oxidoreductase